MPETRNLKRRNIFFLGLIAYLMATLVSAPFQITAQWIGYNSAYGSEPTLFLFLLSMAGLAIGLFTASHFVNKLSLIKASETGSIALIVAILQFVVWAALYIFIVAETRSSIGGEIFSAFILSFISFFLLRLFLRQRLE
ncbi:MAG: hypothetical protein PHP35_00330 [Candidatus Colwellbacteria bacterium]|nr:hypothetical protein [Candidatus Colwellbacteria bacterium]